MIMVKQSGQRSMRHTERRILVKPYATGSAAGLAFPVRGSSRRITIMLAGRKARSTNIRVINRRQWLFRLLLGLLHQKEKQKQKALIGISLTLQVVPYQGFGRFAASTLGFAASRFQRFIFLA